MQCYDDIIVKIRDILEEEWYKNDKKEFSFTLWELCKKAKVFPKKSNMEIVAEAIAVLAEYDAFGYEVKDKIYTIKWTNF